MTPNVIANYTPRQTHFLALHPLLSCFLRRNLESYLFFHFILGAWIVRLVSCGKKGALLWMCNTVSLALSKLNFQFDKCGNALLLMEIWIAAAGRKYWQNCERNFGISKQMYHIIFVSHYESIKQSTNKHFIIYLARTLTCIISGEK